MSDSVLKAAESTLAELPEDRPEIVMRRRFDAPRERVFRMWTDAKELDQWWGPKGFSNTTHAFEFREGGVWEYTMHGPDGTDYPNYVTYREIVPPERIVYDHGTNAQHPDGFRVTVTFASRGEQTELVMRLVLPDMAHRDEAVRFGAVQGGKETLARLAAHVGSQKTRFTIEPGKATIVVSRDLDAPREAVFAAYTDPKAIPEWWGPRKYKTLVDKMEPRRGGEWRFFNVEEDGTKYAFRGVYHDVVAPERIVQTSEFEGWPGQVALETATFDDLDGKTRVTVRSVFQSVADRDAMIASGMEWGARQTWQRLAEYVERP